MGKPWDPRNYMRTWTHKHIHMHIHKCICTYICTHMYTYTHSYTHIQAHLYILRYIHFYPCIHTFILFQIHTLIHKHICTHMHTHTQTHRHAYFHTWTVRSLRRISFRAERSVCAHNLRTVVHHTRKTGGWSLKQLATVHLPSISRVQMGNGVGLQALLPPQWVTSPVRLLKVP